MRTIRIRSKRADELSEPHPAVSDERAAGPPLVDGVDTAGWWISRRFTWWSIRGFAHSMRKKGIGRGARIFSGIMGAVATFEYPILVLIMDRPSRYARIYMSRDNSGKPAATLRVTAHPDNVWRIAEHRSRTPGKNDYGQSLRDKLLGPLQAEADMRGITIETIAASQGLAETYMRELNGLEDLCPHKPRGRKLRRLPYRTPEAI